MLEWSMKYLYNTWCYHDVTGSSIFQQKLDVIISVKKNESCNLLVIFILINEKFMLCIIMLSVIVDAKRYVMDCVIQMELCTVGSIINFYMSYSCTLQHSIILLYGLCLWQYNDFSDLDFFQFKKLIS